MWPFTGISAYFPTAGLLGFFFKHLIDDFHVAPAYHAQNYPV